MVKYWVQMHDTFLSGWGEAEGKKAYYVVECSTIDEAKRIKKNAHKRTDMKNIIVKTNSQAMTYAKAYMRTH